MGLVDAGDVDAEVLRARSHHEDIGLLLLDHAGGQGRAQLHIDPVPRHASFQAGDEVVKLRFSGHGAGELHLASQLVVLLV